MDIENTKMQLDDAANAVVALEKRLHEAKDEIEAVLLGIRNFVEAYSDQLENTVPQDRFAVTCRALERLESQKQSLDEKLWAYFGLEESFTTVTMQLTALQGDMAFQLNRLSDASEKMKRLKTSVSRVDGLLVEYHIRREKYDGIARSAFPGFLEELYRLADAERDGVGFRLQSVLALCGIFCNQLKCS